jgi:ATP-dependent DNA ligase
MGLEGIVSKKRNSIYLPDRSRSWIKVRNPDSPAM